MNGNPDEQPRALNCAALRTLHTLQLKLRRQINDLMAVECEDAAAADALVFAIESAERALEKARSADAGSCVLSDEPAMWPARFVYGLPFSKEQNNVDEEETNHDARRHPVEVHEGRVLRGCERPSLALCPTQAKKDARRSQRGADAENGGRDACR